MATRTVILVVALITFSVSRAETPPPASLPDEMHVYRIESTVDLNGEPVKVEFTGFKMKEEVGIYTALHGVAGKRKIVAISPVTKVGRFELRLVSADVKRDVAYLEPTDSTFTLPRGGLAQGKRSADELRPAEELRVIGYPVGIDLRPADTTLKLRKPALARLTEIIDPDVRAELAPRGSPDTATRMLSLQGHFLPGHSGAPLVDGDAVVVGIGCGGLRDGTVGHGWAVPFQDIQLTAVDSDALRAQIDRLGRLPPDGKVGFLLLDEKARAAAKSGHYVVSTVLENDAKEPVIAIRNRPGDELTSRTRSIIKIMGDITNNNEAELSKLDPFKALDELNRVQIYLPSGTRVAVVSTAETAGQPAKAKVKVEKPEMPALPARLDNTIRNAADLLYTKIRVLEGNQKGNEFWVLTANVRQRVVSKP